jgi:hypothetical protein
MCLHNTAMDRITPRLLVPLAALLAVAVFAGTQSPKFKPAGPNPPYRRTIMRGP